MKALKSFFKFYKRERNGILVLFVFLLSIQYYLYIDEYGVDKSVAFISEEIVDTSLVSDGISKKATLFYFDPNTLNADQAYQLGISKKQFENLKNYRNAGGRFVKENDLSKLYTFDESLCKQLIPFIRLTHKVDLNSIELNSASVVEFQKINGIGKRLSQRITRFRNALGGFVDKNQLYEVYGLDSMLVKKLLPTVDLDISKVKYIDLNKADRKQLKQHPYISEKEAKTILAYRKKNGLFHSVDKIDHVKGLNKKRREKIKLYLTVE